MDSNDFLKNLLGEAVRTQLKIDKQKAMHNQQTSGSGHISSPVIDKQLTWMLGLCIAGIIAFVGSEMIKVIYRNNFGKKAINMFCLVTCSVCFLVLGISAVIYSIDAYLKGSDNLVLGNGNLSFFIAGLLYISIPIYALVRGVKFKKKAAVNDLDPHYQGDSHLLAFMLKDGWRQKNVQMIIEPGLAIIVGICLSMFLNVFAGIPIIICALSLWAYALMQFFFFNNSLEKKVHQMHSQLGKKDSFYIDDKE